MDDGPGIPAGDVERVFDRLYQADLGRDRSSGTSGLGLAIGRAIVEAHGGRVGAANRPEGGARFWLEIPAAVAR
jgi:signal transduction histidine kinase